MINSDFDPDPRPSKRGRWDEGPNDYRDDYNDNYLSDPPFSRAPNTPRSHMLDSYRPQTWHSPFHRSRAELGSPTTSFSSSSPSYLARGYGRSEAEARDGVNYNQEPHSTSSTEQGMRQAKKGRNFQSQTFIDNSRLQASTAEDQNGHNKQVFKTGLEPGTLSSSSPASTTKTSKEKKTSREDKTPKEDKAHKENKLTRERKKKKKKSDSDANGESPSSCCHDSSGAQPTSPTLPSLDVQKGPFVNSISTVSSHRRTGPGVDTGFALRQIQYPREDGTIFVSNFQSLVQMSQSLYMYANVSGLVEQWIQ